MRPDEFKRAHGPYKQRSGRWKIVLVRRDGGRVAQTVDTRAGAQGVIDSLRLKATGSRPIGVAVDDYLKALTDGGTSSVTLERIRYHLHRILGLPENAERPLTWLKNRGSELYEAAQLRPDGTRYAVDTHRNALNEAKRFGAWCVKQRWLRADPFAEVEGVGQRQAGRDKPQHRVNEARKLSDFLLVRCADRVAPEPVAVLAALLLGPRATELVVRDVRDLDDDGRLLVIPRGKTRRAQRSLEVPEMLRPLLLALASGRGGKEPLFLATDAPTARRKLGPRRATRHWLYYHCRALCRAAGVPDISPHGLRRSHGSLAREAGASGHLVAAQLGHGSTAVQERSYVDAGAAQRGQQRAAMKVLQGGKR